MAGKVYYRGNMDAFKIMFVEDDVSVRSLVAEALERWGFSVILPDPASDVVAEFARQGPHLVILDIGLPRFDGFEWCARLREHTKAPILFLTARSQSSDMVRALASGGDDWLSKPFDSEVLVAKVKALLRRCYSWVPEPSALLERKGLILDRDRNIASHEGASVELSKNEAILLKRLLERDGRVLSRAELQDALWSEDAFVDDNTLTVNITRLKQALAGIGVTDFVETVRGQGYRIP